MREKIRGTIIDRHNGTYSIVLSTGKDPMTGRRLRRWTTVRGSIEDAKKKRLEMNLELLNQEDVVITPERATVRTFLTKWLDDYAKVKLSARGYERYAGIVGKYFLRQLGAVPLRKLRRDQLQNQINNWKEAGLKPATIRYHLAVLHKALQTAVKWQWIAENIADGLDLPHKDHREMETWSEQEVAVFLKAASSTPYYSLFYLALFTGMRRSELLGLRWSDVDLDLGQVSVNRSLHKLKDGTYKYTDPKSAKSRRTIALPPSAILMLKQHHEKQKDYRAALGNPLSERDLVFCNIEGRELRPNTITEAWQGTARKAGLKVIRLHDARHTHATLLLKQNVSPKIVQERLGHSSIIMTMDLYSHVTPGMQQAAANKFDNLMNIKPEV